MSDIPGVIKQQNINLGSGYLLIGPANSSHSSLTLQDVGALDGAATLKLGVEKKIWEGGNPAKAIVARIPKMAARLEVLVREWTLTNLKLKLGLPATVNTVAANATTAVAAEKRYLHGTNWFHLQGVDIAQAGFTCVSLDSTPVTFVENTDYEVNRSRGLIRRLSTGSITDGEQVSMSYTYSRAAYTSLAGTQDTVPDIYPLRFVVNRRKNRRIICDVYAGLPNNDDPAEFKTDDWHGLKMAWDAMADLTRDPDDDLWKIYEETIS